MAIITSKTRELQTRRPSGPFVINKASPQFYGLVAWYAGGVQSLTDWNSSVNSRFTLTNNGPTVKYDNYMGRVFSFDDASSQYFTTASAIVSSLPMSFACWFVNDDGATAPALLDIHNSGSAAFRDAWQMIPDTTADGLHTTMFANSSSASTAVSSTNSYRLGEWSHAVGVWNSNTDRRVYCNGTGKNTSTTSRAPTGVNQTNIGRVGGSAPTLWASGMIGDARIYNRVLTDGDVYELWNPNKRWDLYYLPGRVSYFFQTVAAGAPFVRNVNANQSINRAATY